MTRATPPQRNNRKLGIPWAEIERLLIEGKRPRDIAYELGCSVQNVHERITRRKREIEAMGEQAS